MTWNTPGSVVPRRGSTSGTQGPLALPVATINCGAQGCVLGARGLGGGGDMEVR
jgi:hypothetical protein